MTCPNCEYEFPVKEEKEGKSLKLHNDDIMGESSLEMIVTAWSWTIQTAKSGVDMIVVSYYGEDLNSRPIKEYLCVYHDGYAGQKGKALLLEIMKGAGVMELNSTEDMENAPHPYMIKYVKDGKFFRITDRLWREKQYDDELPF